MKIESVHVHSRKRKERDNKDSCLMEKKIEMNK